MTASCFSRLLEPIRIGGVLLKNRVVMPAMLTGFATRDGCVNEQMVRYYARRAEGGTGLIVVEGTCVDDPVGRVRVHQLCIDDDRYIPGLNALVGAVKAYGAKIALQLHHGGPTVYFVQGVRPVAPSPIPLRHAPHLVPRELDKKEIRDIVHKFAAAARRAKEAGFDGVELLCGHGYLLNRFLSPHANRRQDDYGGDLDGRTRIVREIIEQVRVEAGKGFAILCKFPGNDFVDGGITPEESAALCQILEHTGVDALTMTAGSAEGKYAQHGIGCPQGWLVHLAEKVKQQVNIPVAAICRIKGPEAAETILSEGKADLVAFGRALLAEPDLVAKVERRENHRINRCISCNYCLDRVGFEQTTVRCSVNAETGREYDFRMAPADRPRKVLVVGGGPAGMQAAHVAAARGHEVVLVEKGQQLGGQLTLATAPPHKEEMRPLIDYLSGELKERRVDVRLHTTATREVVQRINPEVVIVATGAAPLIPPIPGVDLPHVVTAWDALADAEKAHGVVVVIGAGMVGCDVARFLSGKGRTVTLIEQREEPATDIGPAVRKFELEELRRSGVTLMTRAVARSITETGVLVDSEGTSTVIKADTVVLAAGSKSERALIEALESARMEVHVIGDSVVPRNIVQAMAQGFRVGCAV